MPALEIVSLGEILPSLLLASAILSVIDAAIYFGFSRKMNPIVAVIKIFYSKDGVITFALLLGGWFVISALAVLFFEIVRFMSD